MNHHDTHGAFPTGGWGYDWIGDPDRGFDRRQPGGWVFNILPFIEQQNVYSLGAGLHVGATGSFPGNAQAAVVSNEKKAALTKMMQTPVPSFGCPSRRAHVPYPHGEEAPFNANKPPTVVRTDYAINYGSTIGGGQYSNVPGSYEEGDDRTYEWPKWLKEDPPQGISFMRSEIALRHVSDGSSNTYLIFEKYLNPDHYKTGIDGGDNENMYCGHNNDNGRYVRATVAPIQDRPGYPSSGHIGSAHSGTFNVVFCDGSVHALSYSIDGEMHWRLGTRNDGLPVQLP